MKFSIRITLFVCLSVVFFNCSRQIVRPLLSNNTQNYYLDYQAELLFSPKTTLAVTLLLPDDALASDTFYFPVYIPGSYAEKQYGKYIDNFKALDKSGQEVPFQKIDSSIYLLSPSQPLRRISYTVRQPSSFKKDSIPPFAGMKYTSDFCMLNPYAAFGYFPNLMHKPVRLKFIVPDNWKTGTSLPMDSAGYVYSENYHQLIDNPLLAGDLSYYGFENKKKQYYVYVHSDDQKITARKIKRVIKKSVKDADNFFDGMQSPYHSFLFTFLNDSGKVYGAHEHKTSSMYSLPTKGFHPSKGVLSWVVRHELFHTLIPLSLWGSDIDSGSYNFYHPVSHLWFYEGLAQWASHKMRLINKSLSIRDYLNTFRGMLFTGDIKNDSLDIITLSRQMKDNKNSLRDIYRRGFVFGTLLDMYIIKKTSGNITLREVLLKMKDHYPPGKPFPADSLFTIIASLSHPHVKNFLEGYCIHNQMPDIKSLLKNFGLNYTRRKEHNIISSGFGVYLGASKDNEYMLIKGVYKEARHYGFKNGDTILTIDGDPITPENFGRSIRYLSQNASGTGYLAEVRGKDGKTRVIKARTVPFYLRHKIKIRPDLNQLRYIWTTR
ncbi:MAG: hypothetical protein HQK83_11180 [Fibrobacteria bacterium]|nr:hypothetical protein [Fibrobacteria bacterium]